MGFYRVLERGYVGERALKKGYVGGDIEVVWGFGLQLELKRP